MSLGLLPSVLSHARRILTKVLRIDTDYTTTRAGYIDNIEASNFTTRVQAGMTAQGYTTGRAPNLDNLDTTVSSRLSDANASSRVQTGMTSQGYTTARAGYIDNIEASNFTTRVQAGLNANGYNTTVSGRIDTSVSSRRQSMTTRPIINSSTSGTIISTSSPTVLHGLRITTGISTINVSITIDGVTVLSTSVGTSNAFNLHPNGQFNLGGGGSGSQDDNTYLGWEAKSTMVISASGSFGQITLAYASA